MSLWDENRVERYIRLYGDPRDKKGSQSKLCADLASLISSEASSLLDFGCGLGHLIPHLPESIEKYRGIDSSKEMLEQAKEFFPDSVFIQGNAVTAEGLGSIYGVPFDVTTAVSLLLHLEREEALKVYKNMWLWTKPGGSMIFSMETLGNRETYRNDGLLIRNQEIDSIMEDIQEATNMKPHTLYLPQKITTSITQEWYCTLGKGKIIGFPKIAETTLLKVHKPGE